MIITKVDDMKIVGVALLFLGIVFLYFDIRARANQKMNSFDKVMFSRGLLGGLGAIILGILILFGWFGN